MGFNIGGILKGVLDNSTGVAQLKGLYGVVKGGGGGGGKHVQSYASQMALAESQTQQKAAADAEIANVQSQLTAAQSNQKNWGIGAVVLAIVALGVVVVMRLKKKKT